MAKMFSLALMAVCALAALAGSLGALDAAASGGDSGAGGRSGPVSSARVRVAIPSIAAVTDTTTTVESDDPIVYPISTVDTVGGVSSTDEAPLTTPESGEGKSVDPLVLAMLDNQPITDLDVMRELWERRGKETLEWMIGKSILERELSRLGLDVLDGEVEERLQQHLDGLRKAFPNLSKSDDLTRAASGMRLDEYRERSVWVELALRKIMRAVLKPTDEQLRSYYAEKQAEFIQPEMVRISQVFIAPHPDADNDDAPGPADWALAEEQIQKAHTQLRQNEDFGRITRTYGGGGQLSRWVGRGELLRDLEEAAFGIRPGSISKPLKSSMGYHIIRVEERRERTLPKFEEVRNEVQAQYEEKLFVLMAGEFMTRLREKALKGGDLVILDVPDLFADSRE